ncbi:MAG: hypothetical protein L6Q95_11700 [Planctomycetes bacterium]|nr:hypothetical protein [Planctomycetota bacterium]
MTESKRVPTEAEARLLLRDVARRMEDEAAIEEAASWPVPRSGVVPAKVASLLFVLVVAGVLWFARDETPYPVAMMLILLSCMTGIQLGQVAGLRRATRALARTVERARRAEPLPRAPSPDTP